MNSHSISYPTFSLESRCDSFPQVANATANNTENNEGIVVGWTCNEGYEFPDKSVLKSVTCQKDHFWDPILPNCEGIVHFILIIKFTVTFSAITCCDLALARYLLIVRRESSVQWETGTRSCHCQISHIPQLGYKNKATV